MGFFIASVVFLTVGIGLVVRNWRRSKFWVRTQAKGQIRETYIDRDLDGTRATMDRVRYRFPDARGVIHSFDIQDYRGFRNNELQVTVFYDPQNPRRALIDSARDMYGWAFGLILFGIWLLVFGYLSTK